MVRHSAPLVAPLDALLLKGDADPATRPVMTTVLVLQSAPARERMEAAFTRAADAVPRLRSLIVRTAWSLGQPQWVADPGFNVGDHLKEVGAPGDRSLDAVLSMGGTLATTPFDPARPLWDATLVTGLSDGTAVIVLRVHHAVADGVRALQMMANLLDLESDPTTTQRPVSEVSDNPLMRATQQRAQAISETVSRRNQQARASALSMARTSLRPISSTTQRAAYLRSVLRTFSSAGATPSDLLRDRSRARRFMPLDVPLDDLRRCAKTHGVTVNDVYLTGVLGGVRRYHEAAEAPAKDSVGDTPMSLPIDLADGRAPGSGNHFSAAVIAGPSSIADPGERLQKVHDLVAAKRLERGLDAPQRLAPALQHVPVWLAGVGVTAYSRRVDLQASNVIGPDCAVYLAGVRVERFYAFGPLPSTPVMTVLISYHGTCTIGFTIDPAAVADPELFVRLTAESFDELLSHTRHTPGETAGETVVTTEGDAAHRSAIETEEDQ